MARTPTHGHSICCGHTTEYTAWNNMWTRARNPKYTGYYVEVDSRWESFTTFLLDVGPAPYRHILVQLDVTKRFSKDNAKWMSRTEAYSLFAKRRRKCGT